MGSQSYKLSSKLKTYSPEIKSNYSWDDRGMCRLFSDVYRSTLRFNSTAKEWYRWDGKRWVKDEGGMNAQKRAKYFAEALVIYAATIEDEDTKSSFLKFVGKYGQYRNRKTLVDDARSEEVISSADLDQHDHLYNCQNGIVNLNTYKQIPHDPKFLLSKVSKVVFDPSARSDLWERFINEIMQGDEQKIRYLQKLAGISLTTDTSIERMVIIYGPTTRNGKTTFLEVLAHMHGGADGYAMAVAPETLAKKNRDSRAASGDLARLDGCRLAVASEPPKRMLFDAALVKTMLGRDTITARNLFEREFQFIPKFTLVMNTNYLPCVQDETMFTSGRIDVLPFNRHFTPEEQDTSLKDKLKAPENISGIFNWCLEGLRLYRQEGLIPPAAVTEATKEYQESSDKIGLFMAECMKKDSATNTKGGDAYNSFANWCRANGFESGSKRSFFEDMRGRGLLAKDAPVNGTTLHNVIVGYDLMDQFETDKAEDPNMPWS